MLLFRAIATLVCRVASMLPAAVRDGIVLSGWFRGGLTRSRALTSAALLGYLIAATGLPVVVRLPVDNREPFPCQGHACGCSSAFQCWTNCCCFTQAEKIAWAARNGVVVPTEVARLYGNSPNETLAAKGPDGAIGVAKGTPDGQGRRCCTLGAKPADQSRESSIARSCCRSASVTVTGVAEKPSEQSLPDGCGGPCCSLPGGEPRGSIAGTQRLLVIKALACRGLQTDWVGGGLTILSPLVAPLDEIRALDQLPSTKRLLPDRSLCPPTPPPRTLCVV